jgi:isocitrate dehydrogenase
MIISDQNKEKLARQYDMLAKKFDELYLAGKERGREAMTVALDKAHEQLTALGEFSAEQGEELKRYLARDLDQTISDAKHLGEEARERLHPARLGAGALASIANALELTSNALHSLGEKAKDKLTYKTGEITSAGTLTCQQCGQQIHLKSTGHVPPCPKCNGNLFNKSY